MRELLEDIRGGKDLDREQSEELFQQLLKGELSEIELSALPWISGRVRDLATGTHEALSVLQSGTALGRLQRWAELSYGA